MNAHDGKSTSESVAVASTVLIAAIDSPVRIASSHSNWTASIRRTTSPGTSEATSMRCAVPSRQASASWRMLACNAATATSERYSFTKPSPTLSTTIAAMIPPSVVSPVAAETAAAVSNRISSGLRS